MKTKPATACFPTNLQPLRDFVEELTAFQPETVHTVTFTFWEHKGERYVGRINIFDSNILDLEGKIYESKEKQP
jgi:hypothetical protein